jgi:tripartite-type tricarboxylate transporter receptor subunit TctC
MDIRRLAAAALIALAGTVAHAQDAYPAKPLRFVAPYPPGGSTVTRFC